MRKPRDFDSELKSLDEKTKQLRTRKLHQLGELVIATGADTLSVEQLAGALLTAVESSDVSQREGWRRRGATFFQRAVRGAAAGDRRDARGAAASGDSA